MSSLGELNIQLALNTVEFQNGLTRAQYKARQFSDRTTQYLNNIEKAANNINRTANLDFWGGNLVSGAKSLVNVADGYTEISNKMNLVSSSSTESAARLQTVFDISLKTNQSVQATSDVYQRFAQNAQALGISQAQVANLTETVSKAVAVSGASVASAQAALMQFGQSLASGVFRGQEFNSVMEQTPALAQAIAHGLGVTTGELRSMAKAADGQTSQYQEVKKLTQDIATNAEKYKNFGAEGLAKLQSMAAQIDSATGFGGKYTPAGIVHKGEYVLTKEATSRIGLNYLNYLNYGTTRGFANGGAVGNVTSYAKSVQSGTTGNVSVKVINNGEPTQADVSTKQNGNELEITVELMQRIARKEANNAIQNNFRAGGVFA